MVPIAGLAVGPGLISACGATTGEESSVWEDGELLFISLRLLLLTPCGEVVFPALTTYVSAGIPVLSRELIPLRSAQSKRRRV